MDEDGFDDGYENGLEGYSKNPDWEFRVTGDSGLIIVLAFHTQRRLQEVVAIHRADDISRAYLHDGNLRVIMKGCGASDFFAYRGVDVDSLVHAIYSAQSQASLSE